MIQGGCDLFTTKPIGSDKKLFGTIDKHLDQILEDHQLSQSLERERKHSVHSLASSASPPRAQFVRSGSASVSNLEKERRQSISLLTLTKNEPSFLSSLTSTLSQSIPGEQYEDVLSFEESPFGPLKNSSTRRKFAYLIAILNTTYPDHDFSNLQPTTENFHKVESPESLINKFNNIMVSLGKREDLLSWIWDIVNVYMDVMPSRQSAAGFNSRKNSISNINSNNNSTGYGPVSNPHNTLAISPKAEQHQSPQEHCCKVYEFQPSDQTILEDLNHPYQTMWSNYWFIYNKKKKRVCFLYLTAINRIHYSKVNSMSDRVLLAEKENQERIKNSDDGFSDDYMEVLDIENSDLEVIGDMEI